MPNLDPHPRLVAPLAARRRSRSLAFDEPPTRPVESLASAHSEVRWDPSSARVELGDEDILEVEDGDGGREGAEERDERESGEVWPPLGGAANRNDEEELGATSAYPFRSLPPPPPVAPPREVSALRFVVTAGFHPGEIVLRPLGPDEPPPPDAPIATLDPSCNFDAFRIQKLLAVER
jgi:hypothetical protein